MTDEDKQLLEKMEGAMKMAGTNPSAAIKFFSTLKPEEYDRLIAVFEGNEFPGIAGKTQEKALKILRMLRENLPAQEN
jgi:hypothetical protein